MVDWQEFLEDNGFVRWSYGGMEGWHRQTAFVKDSLVGEVARYYADDYIVTKHMEESSALWLKENWQSKEDVIKHRFLFLDCKKSNLFTKSFWLGLSGWLEILQYCPGDKEKKFADLIFLAEQRSAKN